MNTANIPGLQDLLDRLARTNAPDTPYEPAITTVHLPIDCMLYRVPGIKTGRLHHLLGGIEYIRFLKEDMGTALNIREQFAVPLELSLHVANELKIRHPYNWRAKQLVEMTFDLVVTNPDGTWTALECKQSEKLAQKRVNKKLQITRRIAELANIQYQVCTEKDIPPVTARNYEILHPLALPFDPPPFSPADMARAERMMRQSLLSGKRAVREAAQLCEQQTGLGRGLSIQAAQWLIANGKWKVDWSFKVGPDEPVTFLS